jgi:ribosomal protein S18 acetylase RimI-like enzyme
MSAPVLTHPPAAAGAQAPAPAAVRTARPDEENALLATLTLAFTADPVMRFGFPEPHRYLTFFPRLAKAFGGRAFQAGTAHRAEDYAGAALWLPPGTGPDEEAIIGVLRDGIPADQQADAFTIVERMSAYRPAGPYWYLPFIGVDPRRHRGGLGSALMDHALARCDRDRVPAYLESTNPENLPLYERHGFEVLGTIQEGASPPVFPMLRKARS